MAGLSGRFDRNTHVYLFCFMLNHIHLVVETPQANLGRFMQGQPEPRCGRWLIVSTGNLLLNSANLYSNDPLKEGIRTRSAEV